MKRYKHTTPDGTVVWMAPSGTHEQLCKKLSSAVFRVYDLEWYVEELQKQLVQKANEFRMFREQAERDEIAYQQCIDELDSLISSMSHLYEGAAQ